MPRASKRILDNTVWTEIHDTLAEVISSHDKAALEKFLFEFLTKEEKTMLAKRLTLYLMLLGGYSDTEIKEVLKISHETVRMADQSLKSKSKKFKDNLSSWLKIPRRPKSSNRLIKMVGLALSAKSDRRSRPKLLSGDY